MSNHHTAQDFRSARYHEAARLRAQGLTLREIAERLGVSRQAVHALLVYWERDNRGPDQPVVRSIHCRACGGVVGEVPPAFARYDGQVYCRRCLAKRPELPLPERLRSLRVAAGLSMTDLDIKAGLRLSTTLRCETGKSRPRLDTLARLATVLPELLPG